MPDHPPPPPWLDDAGPLVAPRLQRTTLRRLPPTALAAVVVVAVVAQLALRIGAATVTAALAVTAIAALVVRRPGLAKRPVAPHALVAASAAVLFGCLLAVRASTWLTWLNGSVALGCLAAAAVLHNGPPLRFSTGSSRAVLRRLFASVETPRIVARSARPNSELALNRVLPIVRGLAIAVVPVVLFGALFASADAVFADAIALDLRIETMGDHVGLTLLCGLGLVALLAMTDAPAGGESNRAAPLGAVEATMLLGALALLFAGFALVQLASALGMAGDALARQGVTPADYARSGFFQLLWVAALTAALLIAVRLLVDAPSQPLDRLTRCLGAIVCLLAVLIVVTAIVRLGLYTDAFGQTTLRWYSTAFAWVLGIGFVIGAAGHHRRVAHHLPLTLLSLTAVTLIVCNVVNPEARVAHHNLERFTSNDVELDVNYLTGLSADAWPVLLEHRDRVSQNEAGDAFVRACLDADDGPGWSVFGANLARLRLDCAA